MRRKRVWRYYCDHCKKSGCSKPAMEKHERHCIRNDNRECRMCAALNGGTNQPMSELVAAANESMKKLREVSDDCPICMLAAIVRVQSKDEFDDRFGDFDYRKERENALEVINESKREWSY